MKTLVILTFAFLLILGGCNSATAPSNTNNATLASTSEAYIDPGLITTDDLTSEEAAALIFMREEEKLARDVYLTFFDQYGLQVFSKIAASEQTHTDALLFLISAYGLEDPVGDNPVGIFMNPELQELYDQLVEQGSASLEAALLVGGLIEEVDILDLEERLEDVQHEDIQLTYTRLESASGNHLRAFVRNYESLAGADYTPQLLSPEAYTAIIEAGGPGGGAPGNGRRGNGRGRG